MYRILFHTNCPTDTEGVQVDDIEWSIRDEKYDIISYEDAYLEAKNCVTSGVANTCPQPMDAFYMPPDPIGHRDDVGADDATDSDDAFNMEDRF